MQEELKPFINHLLSIRNEVLPSVGLLYDLAALCASGEGLVKPDNLKQTGIPQNVLSANNSRQKNSLVMKIDRLYRRLTFVQDELSRLDLAKATPNAEQNAERRASFEDIVFSSIDFSRYETIAGDTFNDFFLEGLNDFDEAFYTRNFCMPAKEICSLIERGYSGEGEAYKIKPVNPHETFLLLSVMRNLETSLENTPLFTGGEVETQIRCLLNKFPAKAMLQKPEELYSLLIANLDNVSITHSDDRITRLTINQQGELAGVFKPGGKNWTRVLVTNAALNLTL